MAARKSKKEVVSLFAGTEIGKETEMPAGAKVKAGAEVVEILTAATDTKGKEEVKLSDLQAPAALVPVKPKVEKAPKAEAKYPEKNGVKGPQRPGACMDVWDFLLDRADVDKLPTVAEVKAQAEAREWNATNAVVEYYRVRKYMGLRGRQ